MRRNGSLQEKSTLPGYLLVFPFKLSAVLLIESLSKKASPICRCPGDNQSKMRFICPEKEKKLIDRTPFPREKQGREPGGPLWILASAGLIWPGTFCMAEDQTLNGLSP